LLNGCKVLVAGGIGLSAELTSAELFDASTGTWSATRAAARRPQVPHATLLSDRKVLVAGGFNDSGSSPAMRCRARTPGG
jgi:hypothetical protein